MTPNKSTLTLFVRPLPICLIAGLLLFNCFLNEVHAQTGSNDTKDDKATKSYWKFTTSYLTNSVYNGRQDSLPTPYLTPELGYFDKSGFYVSGSLSVLLSNNTSRLDLSTLNAGYQFTVSDKFSGEVYASKNWYNQSSSNIKSDIKGGAGSSLNYDLNIVQLNGGIDFSFAQKTDYAFNFGLSHGFEFNSGDNAFSIEPSFTANWSTLHSYEGYINRKLKKRKGVNVPAGSTITAQTVVQNNKLTLLDYECSLPLSYETKKIGFAVTPTFAIPLNPIYTTTIVTITPKNGTPITTTENSTPAAEKHLMNRFYVEFAFYVKF